MYQGKLNRCPLVTLMSNIEHGAVGQESASSTFIIEGTFLKGTVDTTGRVEQIETLSPGNCPLEIARLRSFRRPCPCLRMRLSGYWAEEETED